MSAHPLVSVTAPLIWFYLQVEYAAIFFVESEFPAPFHLLQPLLLCIL